jgi:nickel/cobalt exporter
MNRTLSSLLVGLILLVGVPAAVASAHPLGNFTVNRYSKLEIGRESVQLRYVLDLAEIPTLQELQLVGASGAVDESLRRRLLQEKSSQLSRGARLTLNGEPVAWGVESASFDLLAGQADLQTMRVSLTLVAPFDATEGARIDYQDANYGGRIGWHEIVVRAADGLGVRDSTAPVTDQTDELRNYPTDPLRPPLDVSSARATLTLIGVIDGEPTRAVGLPRFGLFSTPLKPVPPELTSIIRGDAGANSVALLAALALAAALGAMHGLGPGHGKTLVAAYLIGSRGTAKHAALLGLTVTVTHTIGVYALGALTIVAARFIVPETLYPLISLVSGLMVLAIGVSLVRSRLGPMAHRQVHTHDHGHSHQLPPSLTLPLKGGGDRHEHDHAHHLHEHHHSGAVAHSHGGRVHSHDVPERARDTLMPRNLIMLGISGGILPCPTALVLLLAAISFHNIPLGLLLVLAFSVGLAGILTAIGMLVVYGGRTLRHIQVGARLAASRPARLLPALSAFVIALWGLAITAQAALSFL